jgi:hypothetical protein
MVVVAIITEPHVIDRILRHFARDALDDAHVRPPPG